MLDFYARHSRMSDPANYGLLLDDVSPSIPQLCEIANNVMIHTWKMRRDKIDLSEERRSEIEIRPFWRLLRRMQQVDPRPLEMKRSGEQQLVVDCRHFALFVCAALRQHGIPARVRVGFASYLERTHWQMHLVCEYWSAADERWIVTDPDIIKYDVPPEQFITAPDAWYLCRSGAADPMTFGYSGNWCGLWAVGIEVVRDLAHLNTFEALSFDEWGLVSAILERPEDARFTDDELKLLDRVSNLYRKGAAGWNDLRLLYESDERLCVPSVIRCAPYTGRPAYLVDVETDLNNGVTV